MYMFLASQISKLLLRLTLIREAKSGQMFFCFFIAICQICSSFFGAALSLVARKGAVKLGPLPCLECCALKVNGMLFSSAP